MIINSWDEKDLPQPSDRFSFENKEKMSLTELLQKSTTIPWKEMNITKTSVYSSLSESINGSINTSVLKALAFLCEKNIIYLWGNIGLARFRNCIGTPHGSRRIINSSPAGVVFISTAMVAPAAINFLVIAFTSSTMNAM